MNISANKHMEQYPFKRQRPIYLMLHIAVSPKIWQPKSVLEAREAFSWMHTSCRLLWKRSTTAIELKPSAVQRLNAQKPYFVFLEIDEVSSPDIA